MQCPIDQTELLMTERQGVEIDYCPKCRGVWLDRGELDKIIERSAPSQPIDQHLDRVTPPSDYFPPQERAPERRDSEEEYRRGDYRKKRKREGFMSDLFDF